jgi:hypothetical protein
MDQLAGSGTTWLGPSRLPACSPSAVCRLLVHEDVAVVVRRPGSVDVSPIRGRSPISGGQPCAQEYARATAAGGPADTPQSAPSRMGASTLAPSARIAVSFLSTLHLLCVDKAIREAIRLHRPQGEHKQRVACDHCHELSERSQTKLSRAV